MLKNRLKEEGAEQLLTNCKQLKLTAKDGKRRLTDVADTEQLLRIIQSVPSPKAEPFKLWLAQVGRERIEETIDPEQAIDRALETYLKKGYSEEWVHQRLLAIRIRNELTEEWKVRGVRGSGEYAILTDEISHAWSGMTTRQYKDFKGLTKENLRDNMSDTELVLNMLGEASTRDISREEEPVGVRREPRGGQAGRQRRRHSQESTRGRNGQARRHAEERHAAWHSRDAHVGKRLTAFPARRRYQAPPSQNSFSFVAHQYQAPVCHECLD